MKNLINMLIGMVTILTFITILYSCQNSVGQSTSIYSVQPTNGHVEMDIQNWFVVGALPVSQDSMLTDVFSHSSTRIGHDIISDTTLSYNGPYHPLYGQLDLNEVYGIAETDTTILGNKASTE